MDDIIIITRQSPPYGYNYTSHNLPKQQQLYVDGHHHNPGLRKASKYLKYFSWCRFNQFLLVGSLITDLRATKSTSDTFLAQTFGNISFTSVRVEEVSQLTVVESGAFDGSEETLEEIIFKFNSALTSFPFEEASCNAVSV